MKISFHPSIIVVTFFLTTTFTSALHALTGDNLLSLYNPGFETGLTNWGGTGFSNASIDLTNPGQGSKSAKLIADPGNSWNVLVGTGGTLTIVPGSAYVLTALARQDLVGGFASLGFNELNASYVSTRYTWQSMLDSPDWNTQFMSIVPASDSAYLRVYLWVSRNVISGASWWDGIRIDRIPDPFADDTNTSLQVSLPHVAFDYNGSLISPATLSPIVKLGTNFSGGVLNWRLIKEADGIDGTPVLQDTQAIPQSGNWQWDINLNVIAPLGPSRYLLTTTAVTADGSETASITKPIAVVSSLSSTGTTAPTAITSSTIDVNGRLLVNGAPFQMILYYATLPSEYAAQRAMGANSVKVTGNSVSVLSTAITQAWNAGLYSWVVLAQPPFSSGIPPTTTWNTTTLTNGINALKHLPGVIGWTLCDEPDGTGISAIAVRDAYNTVKAADPNHVIWVNLTSNSNNYSTYAGLSDFASYDYYPFPFSDLTAINALNSAIKTAYPKKPLISVLQAFGSTGFPSFRQLRAELYTNVCDEMVHPFYYGWSVPPYSALHNEKEIRSYTQLLNWEMQQLQPFLFSLNPALSITLSSLNIRAIAKPLNNGEVILVIVNQSSDPAETISAAIAGRSFTTITPFFPGTSAGSLSGNTITDSLPPYGVGIYRLH